MLPQNACGRDGKSRGSTTPLRQRSRSSLQMWVAWRMGCLPYQRPAVSHAAQGTKSSQHLWLPHAASFTILSRHFSSRRGSRRRSDRPATADGRWPAGHCGASPRSRVDDAPRPRACGNAADIHPACGRACGSTDRWSWTARGWLVAGLRQPGDDRGGRSGLAGLASI